MTSPRDSGRVVSFIFIVSNNNSQQLGFCNSNSESRCQRTNSHWTSTKITTGSHSCCSRKAPIQFLVGKKICHSWSSTIIWPHFLSREVLFCHFDGYLFVVSFIFLVECWPLMIISTGFLFFSTNLVTKLGLFFFFLNLFSEVCRFWLYLTLSCCDF